MNPTALPPNAYLFIPALLNLALVGLFLIGVPLLVVQIIRWASKPAPLPKDSQHYRNHFFGNSGSCKYCGLTAGEFFSFRADEGPVCLRRPKADK